jgi:pyrroline-5-carboxylate reductase
MSTQSVLVVGAGSMGSALVKGLSAHQDATKYRITVCDQHAERLNDLKAIKHVTLVASLSQLNGIFDVVILCVKPHDLAVVSQGLKKSLGNNTLLISFLAGVTIDDLNKALQFNGAIVRSMPNIAATVGLAATAMSASDSTHESQRKTAESILSAVGDAHWIKESLMDAVTGLSGSGPAYIYMVIEAMTDGGVKMGIPRDLSLKLSVQTVLGAAKLVKESGLHPAILRDQVTTPGGTTINAIHELEAHGLRAMLISAIATATKRSQALRKKI